MYLYASYDSQNKQSMSLNSINNLIFVMEMSCIFFEVRSEFLNIM
jgi:hypothetical protein